MKGTYLKGTAEELRFLQPGRSYDWRFRAHNLQEQCCPRRCGFCFSPPMTKANQTPPGSENPRRVLGSSSPAEGTQTVFHPPPPALTAGRADVTMSPQNSPPRLSTPLNEPSDRNPLLFPNGTEVSSARSTGLLLQVCRRGAWKYQEHCVPSREGVKEKTLQFND